MSLFHVDRFLGDGENDDSKTPQEAEDILASLQAQAAARKRKTEEDEDGKGKTKKKKQKKEKKSLQSESETDISANNILENGEAETVLGDVYRKKKKKKRKESLQSDLSDNLEVDAAEYHENIKKKKRKHHSDTENSECSDKETEAEEHKKKKKHKKDKSCGDESANIEEGINDSEAHLPKSKRKHRERYKEKDVSCQDEEFDDPDLDQTDSPVPTKQKKSERKKNAAADEVVEDDKLKGSEKTEETADTNAMVALKEGDQEVGGFTVLGEYKKKTKSQVHRVLPDWLTSPNVVSADLREKRLAVGNMPGLDPCLITMLKENNITHFFPVQMQVIPELLQVIKYGSLVGRGGYRPNDICVSAPTGSGKTLAFVVPIIQALKDRLVRKVRAVAVLPVKDLAVQVFRVFETFAKGTDLKVGLAIGQKPLHVEKNGLITKRLRGFASVIDILVATPGRLVDHIKNTKGFDLSHLRFLVIDEADRMMDEVQQDWLSVLEGAVYNQDGSHDDLMQYGQMHRQQPRAITVANCSQIEMPLQKLLFSATLSQNPEKLQHLNLFQPRLYTSVVEVNVDDEKRLGHALTDKKETEFIGKYTTPMGLTEFFVPVMPAEKPIMMLYFLHVLKFRHILCFTNSLESAHRLQLLIRAFGGGIRVKEFSSNFNPKNRSKVLQDFLASKIDILVCSDAMARGMDVPSVEYVISYDMAPAIKTYIHRIGRTARAGRKGTAITLLEDRQKARFKKMVREAGKTNIKDMKIDNQELSPLVPQFEEALKQLPQLLEKTRKRN